MIEHGDHLEHVGDEVRAGEERVGVEDAEEGDDHDERDRPHHRPGVRRDRDADAAGRVVGDRARVAAVSGQSAHHGLLPEAGAEDAALVELAVAELGDAAALVQHDDAVAQADELEQLGADDQRRRHRWRRARRSMR